MAHREAQQEEQRQDRQRLGAGQGALGERVAAADQDGANQATARPPRRPAPRASRPAGERKRSNERSVASSVRL